jgi:hypothetical protein
MSSTSVQVGQVLLSVVAMLAHQQQAAAKFMEHTH